MPLISRPLAALLNALALSLVLTTAPGTALRAEPPATPLSAPPAISGVGAAAFREARDAWLADDEAAALPRLALLAEAGNDAARLMLALIDKRPELQGPFLALLPRAERIALLRRPGGISGQSWLPLLEGAPLAEAWRALLLPGQEAQAIAAFTALGETRAARAALLAQGARANAALQAIDPETTDPELLFALWRRAGPDRRAAIEALVPEDHPQRLQMGLPLAEGALARWLETSPAAAPVALVCAHLCPAEPAACREAAYRTLPSHDSLLGFGSPAEALVPEADFLASPRGRAAFLQRLLLASPMRGRRAMLARLGESSACLAQALEAEAERYRRPLPGSAATTAASGTADGG